MFGDKKPLRISKFFEEYQKTKEKELTGWEKFKQKLSTRKEPDIEPFYSWECLSLIRGLFNTSFDVVIKDMHHLLCLIHVVHRNLYKDFAGTETFVPIRRRGTTSPIEFASMVEVAAAPPFMLVYKKLKFKMKLAYEAYMSNVKVNRLFNMAIYKTIIQRQ